MRELGRVANEEDGSVIEDPIPVALIGLEFDGESTGVSSSIGGPGFASNGRETYSGANFFAYLMEERLGSDVAEVMSYFEVAMSTGAFGMDLERRNDIDGFIRARRLLTTRSGIRSRSK